MQSGLIFGLICCVSFLLIVSGNSVGSVFATPLFLATPFIGFFFAYKFKKDVQQDGDVSYGRGFFFSLLLYMYATAVLAIVSYIYFQYFDHGEFVQRNLEIMHRPEIKAIITDSGEFSLKDIDNAFKALNPSSIAASIINMNLMLSIPLALMSAFFAMTPKNKQ